MAVFKVDDPAEGLYRLYTRLDLVPSEAPMFIDFGEATLKDFEGLGVGAFGSCVFLVGANLHFRLLHTVFEGFPLGLLFFSSENWGGTNEVSVFENGEQVADWHEADPKDSDHPLLADLSDDLHPYDRVHRVAERVLGILPEELGDQPLFLVPSFR